MGDSETEYIVELQPKVAGRLQELGFGDTRHRDILAHGLAEIASRGRTLDQQALPLFLSLDPQHRRALAEVTVALKNHLDAMHGLNLRHAQLAGGTNRFSAARGRAAASPKPHAT